MGDGAVHMYLAVPERLTTLLHNRKRLRASACFRYEALKFIKYLYLDSHLTENIHIRNLGGWEGDL